MPEEVNRVVADAVADLLFVTSPEAIANLAHEGVAAERIHFVGNPMIDTLLARDRFDPDEARGAALPAHYGVVTCRRPTSTDDAAQPRVALLMSSGCLVILPSRGRAASGRRPGRVWPLDRRPLGYLSSCPSSAGRHS
jgi:UDP-N-acetylglucosamine 2-epimerase (non-hydrolysing)